MRMIETKVHGYMDYIMGALLILLPIIANWDLNSAQSLVPMILGFSAIIYSLVTDYELSVTNMISMKTHLTLDFLSGAVLAASPWLFGFADVIWIPHVILGIVEIMASLMTKTKTHVSAKHHHATHH